MNKVQPGDVLYFTPEKMTIMVVMSGYGGIRYIEPTNLEFDDNGHIVTTYLSYADIWEWTVSLGNIADLSEVIIGKKS